MRYKVFDIVGSAIVFSSNDKDEALNFMAENGEKYGCLIFIDVNKSLKLSEIGGLDDIS